MNGDRDLMWRVAGLTGGLVAATALLAWALAGSAEALGALLGGAITIANFLWLAWTAGLAVRRAAAWPGVRQALWLGASAVRFGVVALAFGLVAAQGWLGLTGLLTSLTALPVVVVGEGLRAARAG